MFFSRLFSSRAHIAYLKDTVRINAIIPVKINAIISVRSLRHSP